MIPLAQINQLAAEDFAAALSSLFERSPWVPERVAALRPFDTAIALHGALCRAVLEADEASQLALIRAHPELAGTAASRGDLTSASRSEQKGAGLSSCTAAQTHRLRTLNGTYHQRFGFPFVLAVRGHTPDSVIATLARRVTHEVAEERQVALGEIFRIARFRLIDLLGEPSDSETDAMADNPAGHPHSPRT